MVPLLMGKMANVLFLLYALLAASQVEAQVNSPKNSKTMKLSPGSETQKPSKSVSRVAEINEVSHLDDHLLRIIFNAQERDGHLRFPITTIDRSMVKVEFTNTSSPPADPKSLLLHGSGGAELRRALYIGFGMHRNLNASSISELKSQVGDLIKSLPAELLTVAAIAQDSGRVIADVNPEKGDNTNRIIQQLQSLEPEGEGPALADTFCVAAERFHAWDLSKFKNGDQKVLIVLSSPGDPTSTERYRAENCWRSLMDQGIRVFVVAFGKQFGRESLDLTSVATDGGGHLHRVSGPVEMYAATKNIIALLNNEYVIDVDAPDINLEDQPLELKLKISYHDEVFESSNFNVGFVIPALSKVFAKSGSSQDNQGEPEQSGTDWETVFIVLVVVISLGGLGLLMSKQIKNYMATTACSTCGVRVKLDHSDCPFRKPDCVARLVVVGGTNAGQTIPVTKGETSLARFSKSGARIKGKNIAWFKHGTIRLDGQKALYSPKKPGRDRINGWLVHEPRLLGIGSVLTIGDQRLRFEVKPQIHV